MKPDDSDPSVREIRELVRRTLAGEARAAAELVDRFRGQVFGLCYRMLGHREDAEDVAQEAFLRALRSLRNWDSKRDFAPWLLAIAGNRCRTWLAARAKRPSRNGELDHVADPAPPADDVRNLTEEVELALADVRWEYREAFLLFHQQELSYQQIADALGCPVGTIKTWVHRARRELIERLQARGVIGDAPRALRRV